MASAVLPPSQPGGQAASIAAPAASLTASIETTTHLLSIAPSPSPSSPTPTPALSTQNIHFVANIVHLRDSLAAWVGTAPRAVVDRARRRAERAARATGTAMDGTEGDEGEAALDEELAEALRRAGRLEEEDDERGQGQLPPPCGALAVEWAVAMTRKNDETSSAPSTLATSLFRTNADLAVPMASRLGTKLGIPQLFLSLDLPPALLGAGGGAGGGGMVPVPPERTRVLLLLERGLADAIRQGIKQVEGRRTKSAMSD